MEPVARQFVCAYQSVLGPALDPLGRKFKDNCSANRIKHSLVNHKLILSRAIKGKQPGFRLRVREKF